MCRRACSAFVIHELSLMSDLLAQRIEVIVGDFVGDGRYKHLCFLSFDAGERYYDAKLAVRYQALSAILRIRLTQLRLLKRFE